MQVYVHLTGKNHGPYSIDQLRQYVQAGNFRDDHLACYDGTNWVKIKDVPGFTVVAKKAKPVQQKAQQKAPQKTKKMRTKKLLVVSLGVIVALLVVGGSVAGISSYLIGDNNEPSAVTPKDIFTLSPDQIVEVYDGDTFKIDLPSQHPLFGDDISVRVFGIDTPEMRGTSDEVKALAYKAKNRTQEMLSEAKTIELKNPQRDKYFRVLAEVWIDGESLGEKLKSDGLAKDYDGEGARPEW
jgi:endonuclease YncB( thermonuclease family)